MRKKLTGRALAKFEASRDVWEEVLDGVRQIKAGGGKRCAGGDIITWISDQRVLSPSFPLHFLNLPSGLPEVPEVLSNVLPESPRRPRRFAGRTVSLLRL